MIARMSHCMVSFYQVTPACVKQNAKICKKMNIRPKKEAIQIRNSFTIYDLRSSHACGVRIMQIDSLAPHCQFAPAGQRIRAVYSPPAALLCIICKSYIVRRTSYIGSSLRLLHYLFGVLFLGRM